MTKTTCEHSGIELMEFNGIPKEEYVLVPGDWDITCKNINSGDEYTIRFVADKNLRLMDIKIANCEIIRIKHIR